MVAIEIFTAGCPCCAEAEKVVRATACPSCTITLRDMKDPSVAAEAKRYGINRVPAVVVDGKLAGCCAKGGVDAAVLRAMGVGSP